MHDDKIIKEAMYLNKSNGELIDFKIQIKYKVCSDIQKMID
jgi:hypothetical protein